MAQSATSRKALERLLDQRNEHPERLVEIDRRICATFEKELAILVLDMCGFSRLTLKHGIIHYLSMIRRMQRISIPLVLEADGRVLKTEADNLFAVFDTVPNALRAALAIHESLSLANAILPEDWDVHVGIGIGFGKVLMIGEDDLYGSEMNLASKLGEDLAEAGEVLLTESAWRQLRQTRKTFEERRAKLGKLEFAYYATHRDTGPEAP